MKWSIGLLVFEYSIIAHNKIFLFYQKILECDVIFGWRHHFCWWRHQKSVKIRPKLKIRQILNRLSSQSGWPIKLKLVHRPVLQTGFGYTCPHSFVLTSAYLMMTSSKICQKLKIRQHDVIKSDFQKNFRKCSSTSYYVCVQRWSHLEHLNGSYSIFRIVRFSMGIIGKKQKWRHQLSTEHLDLPTQTSPDPKNRTKCVNLNLVHW